VRVDWAILNAHEYELFFGARNTDVVDVPVSATPSSSNFTEEFRTWQIDSRDVKLLKRIGEGHFSTVWLARRFGEKVAVKQLRPGLASDRLQREFENEVKRMTTLPPHGNVVALLGITEFPDTGRALVVQFCARGSLQDALYGSNRIDFTLTQLVRVAREAACGVAHLHRHRVIP
jgi:serine/threonine protein kinase